MVTPNGPNERIRWVVDGNNVFGSRPDGWWNDRAGAMARFTDRVARWCRTHDDPVLIVFDRPVPDAVIELGGGNLTVRAAARSGRNAADDEIVAEVDRSFADQADGGALDDQADGGALDDQADGGAAGDEARLDEAKFNIVVVTSDRGLRDRLGDGVTLWGVGRFRELIGY